jgi:serine/threonine-protein kinase
MGDVHLARLAGPAGFQRWVVVKVLLPELAPSARYRDMFLAEARLAARLSHPNVCEVLDLGEEGGTYYIVMPYLDGVPLAALMQRPPEVDDIWYRRLVTGVLAQACAGLHHAHELAGDDGASLGVVHRDVSPSNVMVLRDGVVKVVDFGIAKSRASEQVTEKDVIKGKPAYMAPEQLAGGAIDRRADVFCLGILLWEALAQRKLFERASSITSARAVLEEEAPRLEEDGLPARLAEVVARALEKQPYKRQATAEQLRKELVIAMVEAGGVMPEGEIRAAIAEHWSERLRPPPAGVDADGPTVESLAPTVKAKLGAVPASQVATDVREAAAAGTPLVAWVLAIALSLGVVTWAVVLVVRDLGEPEVRRPHAALPTAAPPDARGADAAPPPPDASPPTPPDAAPSPDVRDHGGAKKPQKGSLSVDSSPWATIYVDGKKLGITPLIGKSITAGKHRLRAVTEDGRVQERDIVIEAGASPTPIRLHW